jgi:hypothetical protein
MMKVKHEWKKHEKELYQPKTMPQLLTVPKHKYFAIKGIGNPNHEDFSERVGVLYSLAYAIRMMPKTGFTPDGYFEYTVYPLEGVWEGDDANDKDSYRYTIMIRQPDFVTTDIADFALGNVKKKKPHPLLEESYFCEMSDDLSVQILHMGDYDNEPASFDKLLGFILENRLTRNSNTHREIYLNDATKVERGKLLTVLRYTVTKLSITED